MYCLQYELEKHFTSEERKKQQTECFERREKRGRKNPIKHEEKIQIIPTKFMYEIFDSLCSVFQLCARA